VTGETSYSLLRSCRPRPLWSALAQRFANTEPNDSDRLRFGRLYWALRPEDQSRCREELGSLILIPKSPQDGDLVARRKLRNPRCYRTHAFVAQLFAGSAGTWNRGTWEYLASAWTDLAAIKQGDAETKAAMARRQFSHAYSRSLTKASAG
jgi:hypothetical protein